MLRIALVVLLASVASAQWISLHTEGIPRTEDGKVDMQAPAPRTADGKPDFSGLWWPGGEQQPCGPECPEAGLGTEPLDEIGLVKASIDVGYRVEGGLPYQPWAKELVNQRVKRAGLDDPHVQCLPSNPPRNYTLPHLTRTILTPKTLVMLNEFNASYRQIYLDDRELPEDPFPAWNGYSVGHWEDDTLVIETIGFRDDLWLDMKGDPLTNAGKLTERITRPNFGTLHIELTVDDPNAYTKPFTVPIDMKRVADTEMIDEVCLEGESDFEHMKDLKK